MLIPFPQFLTLPHHDSIWCANSQSLADELEKKIVNLILETTLDKGQLVNFIDSLRNPVHLTQGPPGTGKSYLGVVLVRALLCIRDLWMNQNPSVGCPPILVLSYKNHATDEFLCDLLQAERKTGTMWPPNSLKPPAHDIFRPC